jgi:hypothetical protein
MVGPLGILVALPISALLIWGAVWLLMWGLSLLNLYLAMAVGLASLCYLVFSAGMTLMRCAAEPVFIPPSSGDGGEGRMIFACDGPGGMLSYGYVGLVVPLAGLAVSVSMVRLWRRRYIHA